MLASAARKIRVSGRNAIHLMMMAAIRMADADLIGIHVPAQARDSAR